MLGIEERGIIFWEFNKIRKILNNSMHSAPGVMLLHRECLARFLWRSSVFFRPRNIHRTNCKVQKPFFGNKIKTSGKIIETSKDRTGRDVLDHMVPCW